jgi:Osmosensitive K+ channel His kinase sensor domain
MIAMSGGMSADSTSSASRGRLRVYLAIAPGAGKTYAMLAEAKHLAERGVDVVVGFVETHGRAATEAMLGPLERIALAHISHRGSVFDELDAFWPSSTHDAPPATPRRWKPSSPNYDSPGDVPCCKVSSLIAS